MTLSKWAAATAAILAARYKNVGIERMDVTRPEEIDALAAKLKSVPIDVVINNAGVGRPLPW